jgi:hypothetical protein
MAAMKLSRDTSKWISGKEQSPETDSHRYSQPIFDKGQRQIQDKA